MSEATAISYEKTGKIKLTIEDKKYTIRRPKYGEFRKVKDALMGIQEVINEAAAERGIDVENMTNADPEFVDQILDATTGAILFVFNGDENWSGLSDTKLPTDIDEWPTWLVLNSQMLTDFITHWRHVPLVHG